MNKFNIDNLVKIKEHFYSQEIEFIEEEVEINLPENLDKAIQFCEDNYLTNMIGYNFLILKKDLQKLI